MGVEFTLSALAQAMALIGCKIAIDNSIKAGNMLSNPKSS